MKAKAGESCRGKTGVALTPGHRAVIQGSSLNGQAENLPLKSENFPFGVLKNRRRVGRIRRRALEVFPGFG